MQPIVLRPNLIDHFYRGGARIGALRGLTGVGDRQPEEWIASTVTRFGEEEIGLARTEAGEVLRDLVAADPAGWLGPDHALGTSAGDTALRTSAVDTGLLVKLLDAGQRLPVHVHPDRSFARSHLACPYGKTEAWVVLDTTPGAVVHLGWSVDVDPAELAERRDAQDGAWMLDRMNRIEVHRGDGIVVPAGQVHALGEGVFVLEAQEPTDWSILLEWSVTTATRDDSHLGLGFDTVMPAVQHDRLTSDELARLMVHVDLDAGATSCLAAVADRFFRVELVTDSTPVPAGFAAVVVLGGDGSMRGTTVVDVSAGMALAVPAGFGDWSVAGSARLLVARPGAGWPSTLADRK